MDPEFLNDKNLSIGNSLLDIECSKKPLIDVWSHSLITHSIQHRTYFLLDFGAMFFNI